MKDGENWFPHKGLPREKIDEKLNWALTQCINYESDGILGFPGTVPSEIGTDVFNTFSRRHPNNIGYHTDENKDPAEMGFIGTQLLEKEFVYGVAEMIGVKNPPKEIDGYVCSGGTDGNYHGLWIARNMFWDKKYTSPLQKNNGIVVIHSFLFHYSIVKSFNRLLHNGPVKNPSCENIDAMLPMNERGELEPGAVEECVRAYQQEGYSRFAVFLTAGTTNMGSIDPVYEICEVLQNLQEELGIQTYVHVDAAFGGFVIPFVEPDCRFAFQHPLVQSVSIDAHKTGWAPYPTGIFLCRKKLLKFTMTEAWYVSGHADYTVPGSRSGAAAAACWAIMHQYGHEGFNGIIQACMENASYLREKLTELPDVHIYNNRLNILAIRMPEGLHISKEVCERFCVVQDRFPKDLTLLKGKDRLSESDMVTVYRFTVMPHVTHASIDQFISSLNLKNLKHSLV
jgi:tyrosine decarboxylase/aspartate 1-decarboxylase